MSGAKEYKRREAGSGLNSLLLFLLRFSRATRRFFLGDTIQFALGDKPAFAPNIGHDAALDHLAAETTKQLFLRLIGP
jgi:hypothetical protein